MSDREFREFEREALEKFLPHGQRRRVSDFLNRLSYQPLEATTLEGFEALAKKVGEQK